MLYSDSLGLGKPIAAFYLRKCRCLEAIFRVDRASGASAWGGKVAVVFRRFFVLVVCMYVINLDLASLSGIAG